jgi:hypothetical protein
VARGGGIAYDAITVRVEFLKAEANLCTNKGTFFCLIGQVQVNLMALAAVSRIRKANAIDGISSSEHGENHLPSYLMEFPDKSSRIKDLQLAVLLGRWQATNAMENFPFPNMTLFF